MLHKEVPTGSGLNAASRQRQIDVVLLFDANSS